MTVIENFSQEIWKTVEIIYMHTDLNELRPQIRGVAVKVEIGEIM